MAWNQPIGTDSHWAQHPNPKKASHRGLWIVFAAVVVTIITIGGYWMFFQSDSEKEQERPIEKKDGLIAEVKPSASAKQETSPLVAQKKAQEAEILRRRETLKKMTPEEKMDYLFELAKNQPLPEEPSSNRIFRTSLEQVMDWVFSCEVGSQPPLLPPMSMFDEAHLAEILVSDNPIKETDSERAKDAKEVVQLAKEEFRKFIKEGGDPFEFLPYYHGQLVKAHDEWKTARESIMDVIRKEPDIALEFAEKVNADLEAKGIKKVVLPEKMLQKFGILPQE